MVQKTLVFLWQPREFRANLKGFFRKDVYIALKLLVLSLKSLLLLITHLK